MMIRRVIGAFCLGAALPAAAVEAPPLRDIVQVSVGRAHTCALTRAGAVLCWGGNSIGQLGLGEVSELTVRPTAVPVPGLEAGVRSIASGDFHTCAILDDRSVRCWGLNGAGAIGSDSEAYSIPVPAAVQGLDAPALAVDGGGEHSCAVLQGGSLRCWGNNAFGQLGDGSTVARTRAVAVAGLPAAAAQVSLGGNHSCARLVDGALFCWGANNDGQLGDGSRTQRAAPARVVGMPGPARWIAAGSLATCALSAEGGVFCWGPQYPLLAFFEGDGGSLNARAYPGFASGYNEVEAGAAHFCARAGDGRVKCFGDDAFGQLGTGLIDGSAGAEFVLGLDGPVGALASGGWHNCVRDAGDGLRCWGQNTEGQLGIDAVSRRIVPTPVAGLQSGVAALAAGGFNGCALSTGGGVKCWGANGSGAVGDGSNRFRLTAVDVQGLGSGVRAIDAGDGSACALTTAGAVKCWGANFDGRLGVGDTLDRNAPADVQGLGGVASAVAVGRQHGCALVGGGVRCWGDNAFGQLGSGDAAPRLTATAVLGIDSGASALAAGYFHTCAVVGEGVRCWGNNVFGQLGDGTQTDRRTPVAVQGLAGPVAAVSAGIRHTCALLRDGAVQCWGDAFFGILLGDGSQQSRSVAGPPLAALGRDVVELSLGNTHSCVRLRSGAMRCWGQGGTIGDNSLVGRSLPTPVAGLDRAVSQISAGFGTQSCAVQAGAALCWGDNTFAQLGDGSTHGVPTAQVVLSNEIIRRVGPVVADADAPVGGLQFDASGRFAVFVSDAGNLVPDDRNGLADIFLVDRERGGVRRVSVDNAGSELRGGAGEPSISGDGQLVVFVAPEAAPAVLQGESKAAREARRKSGGHAVFLRNVLTGTTQRIGRAAPDGQATPMIATGGGAVVYAGPAVAGEGAVGQTNVFRVALTRVGEAVQVGTEQCLSCKSAGAGGPSSTDADGESTRPVVSADGQWVAWQSKAANALAGQPSPCPAASSQVILRNALTGSSARISPPSALPAAACGSAGSQKPSIDFSGQVIALQSDQAIAGDDRNALDDTYVWRAGEPTLLRISAGTGGDAGAAAVSPQVSGDGRHVAFVSRAADFDLGFADNNEVSDLHAVSLANPDEVRRLSRTASGAEADGDSSAPVLNFDGSDIGFVSKSSNLLRSALTGRQDRPFARDNPLSPTKRAATWWIPAESGWGLTVFEQGGLLAPIWYTYDADGEPTWFIVSGAFPQPDGSFRGDLFRLTGTPLAQIEGPAARSVTPAGAVNLRYLDEATLQFDYQADGVSQRKTLQRFPFGPRDFRCRAAAGNDRAAAGNYTDLWSGDVADAGWGLNLFHIDDLLVATWYTYDLDGEAVFFLITATRQGDGRFAGEVFRQRNGTPFSRIDGAAPSPGSETVGSASFRFLQGDVAEFGYRIGAVDQTRRIRRLLVGDQATVCRAEDAGAP